jgi:hypothetical protein
MEDEIIGYDTNEYVDIDIVDAYDRNNVSDNFTDEEDEEDEEDDDKSDISSSSSIKPIAKPKPKPKTSHFSNTYTYILQEEYDFAAEINIF